MFQRLESVLNSELRSLGHPRAALLGFAVAVLAYNVLSLLQRCVEQAHQDQKPPPDGVRPWGWTVSSRCFDRLLGVLILELHGAEIAQGRVQAS